MQKTIIKSKSKISTNIILSIMFILMLLDYILTYYGINSLGIITEANPLMVSLVYLPFYKGFAIRIVISSIPVFLLKWAENKVFVNSKAYIKLLAIVLSIQLIPYSVHFMWLYYYLKIVS